MLSFFYMKTSRRSFDFAQALPMQINKQEGNTVVSFKSLYNRNVFNKLQLDMGRTAKDSND